MGEHSALTRLLARARRRQLTQLILEQWMFALSLAMGGAILLLVAGTQILDWYWPVLLFGGGLAVGLRRMRQRIPSGYLLAQRIDRRLGLCDTLSTAFFFSAPEARGPEPIRQRQREQAEATARGVDLPRALPFMLPRSTYTAAGLVLVALGLFTLRYGVTGSLSLKPSLMQIAFDSFLTTFPNLAKTPAAKQLARQMQKVGLDVRQTDSFLNNEGPTPDAALDTVDVPDVNNPDTGQESKSKASGQPNEQPSNEAGESDEKSDKSSSGPEAPENAPANESGGQSGNQTPQNNKQSSSQQENSSLMEKMRDAMANLLNKLKLQPKPADGRQSAQNSQSGREQQKSAQKGAPNSNRSTEATGADAEQQGEQQSNQQSQSAQARSGDKAGERSASQDAKSGVGSQEGNKDAHLAEQLEAMGKISEILGKRSANVSGEVMVEVSSSKQQIKTPWAQRQAAHAEAGGEIHRDEVPLIYQQYVQQYFEEIRKAPGGPSVKAAKSAEVKGETKPRRPPPPPGPGD